MESARVSIESLAAEPEREKAFWAQAVTIPRLYKHTLYLIS